MPSDHSDRDLQQEHEHPGYRSACCGATVHAENSLDWHAADEGPVTCFWLCERCLKACDVVEAEEASPGGGWMLDDCHLAESEFCECGTTLMGDPDESDGLCGVCAAAPHHRECCCDECEAYWQRIARETNAAAEKFNRRLLCTCGWTGAYPEHHRDRQPTCEINLREEAA